MGHLIPTYRQKLKLCKPAVRTSKQWSSDAIEDLRACLDCTNWEVFSLDEFTEAVTSYISFCEDCCIPSRTRVSYNNDKPWFTAKLSQLRRQKEEAFKSGDRDRFKESKHRFSKAVREAKRLYSEKLKLQFSANDSASVWKGLRQITNYKPKPPPTPLTTSIWPTAAALKDNGTGLTPTPVSPATTSRPPASPRPLQQGPWHFHNEPHQNRPPPPLPKECLFLSWREMSTGFLRSRTPAKQPVLTLSLHHP